MYNKNGIRTDLVVLWRKNMREILSIMNITHKELADYCGVSRQSISTMFCRKDGRLTGIQFLGTMRAIQTLIEQMDIDDARREKASILWNELQTVYKENGFV